MLELEAVSGQVEQRSQSGSFQGAEARVYSKGQLAARMEAPHVEATAEKKVVRAWGGVMVLGENPRGLKVDADRLEWYLQANRIVAYGRVRFIQRNADTGRVVAEGGMFERVTIDTERQRLTIP